MIRASGVRAIATFPRSRIYAAKVAWGGYLSAAAGRLTEADSGASKGRPMDVQAGRGRQRTFCSSRKTSFCNLVYGHWA